METARGYELKETLEDETEEDAAWVVQHGVSFAEELQSSDKPWFLHLHFYDPHDPYDAPSEYLEGIELLQPIPWDLSEREGVGNLKAVYANLDSEQKSLVQAHMNLRYDAQLQYLERLSWRSASWSLDLPDAQTCNEGCLIGP